MVSPYFDKLSMRVYMYRLHHPEPVEGWRPPCHSKLDLETSERMGWADADGSLQ